MSSYTTVDIVVVTNDAAQLPVEGVVVRVFDETNVNFFTQDVTDADGRVGFTLFTQRYYLRFFKFGAQLKQPLVIDVIDPPIGQPLYNTFVAKATIFQLPLANDARLCRASGFFRDVTGAPHPQVDIHFIAKFDPILLEGAGILSERRAIRTDAEGFACIDLIRGARYSVLIQGNEDEQRQIEVPDLPSVNLPDLLFTVVDEIVFDLAPPYSLSVGQILVLTPTVIGSNKVPLAGTAVADVKWSTSNDSVISMAVAETTITLTGRTPGSVDLKAERLNQSIIRIPNTPIVGVPQTVTVS